MTAIQETLRHYLATNILFTPDGFQYSDEDSFLDNGIIDSTGVVELVAFIEGQYKISVEDSEITPQNFDSINSLADYVRRKLQ